jgi:hypothetical protein
MFPVTFPEFLYLEFYILISSCTTFLPDGIPTSVSKQTMCILFLIFMPGQQVYSSLLLSLYGLVTTLMPLFCV